MHNPDAISFQNCALDSPCSITHEVWISFVGSRTFQKASVRDTISSQKQLNVGYMLVIIFETTTLKRHPTSYQKNQNVIQKAVQNVLKKECRKRDAKRTAEAIDKGSGQIPFQAERGVKGVVWFSILILVIIRKFRKRHAPGGRAGKSTTNRTSGSKVEHSKKHPFVTPSFKQKS